MIKHTVMFKLKEANGKSEFENALEAKERFNKVIENVKELKKARWLLILPTHPKIITQ